MQLNTFYLCTARISNFAAVGRLKSFRHASASISVTFACTLYFARLVRTKSCFVGTAARRLQHAGQYAGHDARAAFAAVNWLQRKRYAAVGQLPGLACHHGRILGMRLEHGTGHGHGDGGQGRTVVHDCGAGWSKVPDQQAGQTGGDQMRGPLGHALACVPEQFAIKVGRVARAQRVGQHGPATGVRAARVRLGSAQVFDA